MVPPWLGPAIATLMLGDRQRSGRPTPAGSRRISTRGPCRRLRRSSRPTDQPIAAGAAEGAVPARAAEEDLVGPPSAQEVVAGAPQETVVAAFPREAVVAPASGDAIVAGPRADQIGAATGTDAVVARVPRRPVAAAATDRARDCGGLSCAARYRSAGMPIALGLAKTPARASGSAGQRMALMSAAAVASRLAW
jgi:hypothetical protein